MRYWVIKGNPRDNDWNAMLVPGRDDDWHSGRVPRGWAAGDRIFCWESAPALRVLGLAELRDTDLGIDENGDTLFRIRCLTRRLGYMPNIQELRAIQGLKGASFLKTGPATTLFPLTNSQAGALFSVLLSGNPELAALWPDLSSHSEAQPIEDLDLSISAVEGHQYLAVHLRRERRPELIAAKKKQGFAVHGTLACEACEFDFAETYGQVGQDFCEVHHLKPLSETRNAVETKLDHLAIVCSNCHRMLHRSNPTLSIVKLRELIRQQPNRGSLSERQPLKLPIKRRDGAGKEVR